MVHESAAARGTTGKFKIREQVGELRVLFSIFGVENNAGGGQLASLSKGGREGLCGLGNYLLTIYLLTT